MAAVPSTELQLGRGVLKTTWGPLTSVNSTGVPVSLPQYPVKTVYVRGTPGGSGGVTIKGRNNTTGAGATLHDLDGANLSGLTELAGLAEAEGIAEATMQEIWPELDPTPDGATSLTVEMVSQLL